MAKGLAFELFLSSAHSQITTTTAQSKAHALDDAQPIKRRRGDIGSISNILCLVQTMLKCVQFLC